MNFYVLYLNLSDYIYFLRQTVKKFFARRQAHRIVEDGDRMVTADRMVKICARRQARIEPFRNAADEIMFC